MIGMVWCTLYCCQCVVALCVQDLNVRLKKLVDASKCIVFMKGTPVEPRCGECSFCCKFHCLVVFCYHLTDTIYQMKHNKMQK